MDTLIEIFTFAELADIAGLPRPTASDWFTRGLFRASICHEATMGKERKFSFADVFAAWLLKNFRNQGLTPPLLQKISDTMYGPGGADLLKKPCLVLVNGIASMRSVAETQKMIKQGLPALVVHIPKNAEQLRAEITAMRAEHAAKILTEAAEKVEA